MSARTMEIIAVTSGKGGTGKTIVSACLGYALTRAGHRVLMVDADTSTDGLSLFLLGPQGVDQRETFRPENTFAAVLAPEDGRERPRVQPRQINRSASDDHGVIYQALISGTGLYGDTPPPIPVDREQFRDAVANLFGVLEERGEYDYVIVDTRGGFSFDTTDVCALAHSFILVTEPDYTSFYQARNLVREVSAAAQQLERRPLLRTVFVNKALEVTQETGALDLAKMEVSFRLELVKEFEPAGVRFEDTHPIPLDAEVLKAYKTQQMPLRHAPAYKFSFAVLTAFSRILRVITSPWDREQAEEWNRLVDSVSVVIAEQNAIVRRAAEEERRRTDELAELRMELGRLRDELGRSQRELAETQQRYERELSRTQLILESLQSTTTKQTRPAVSPWLLAIFAFLTLGTLVTVLALEPIREAMSRTFGPTSTPAVVPPRETIAAAPERSQAPTAGAQSTPGSLPPPTTAPVSSPAATAGPQGTPPSLLPPTAAPAPSPAPTATIEPKPEQPSAAPTADPRAQVPPRDLARVLYEADWGVFLKEWDVTPDWQVIGGALINDGSREKSLARAPWHPSADQDYAVEAEIRSERCTRTGAGTGFGVIYAETETPGTPWFVNLCSEDPASPSRRGEWLIQRVEIRGDLINQCQNGTLVPIQTGRVRRDQTRHSQRSQFQAVGLFSDQERIEVRSFKVVQPTPGELCVATR